MLLFDWFQEDSGVLKTSVGWVTAFSFVAHTCSVATTCVGVFAVCSAVERQRGRPVSDAHSGEERNRL